MNTEQRDNTTPELWRSLPDAPGVYLMKASDGSVIYVGESDPFAHARAFLFSRKICTRIDIADDAVCY